VVDHLRPRRVEDVDFFPDKETRPRDQDLSADHSKAGRSGFSAWGIPCP